MDEPASICGQWKITEYDLSGNVVSEKESGNLVVNAGRQMIYQFLFGLTGASSINAVGVGASSVANDNVTSGVLATDTRLTYELRGNATRKAFTNVSGAALSNSDFTLQTTVISGTTYYAYVTLQAQFAAGDGNNGNIFNEYGLFTTATLPLTPTGSSGLMFNRFVDPAPITKAPTNSVTAQITLRF